MIGSFLELFLLAAALFVGSFITAAAKAWPDWKQIVAGRSACGACGYRLRPIELIPVVSYLMQAGKCRACGVKIWWLHQIGEITALIIAVLAIFVFDGWPALIACLFGWTLLFGALVDARTFLLPDVVTLGLIPVGLGLGFLQDGQPGLVLSALGAIIGFASLAAIAFLYRWLRGREGLGLGDAKLLAAGGAWAGPFALPWIVALGAGATLTIVLIAHLFGRKASGDTAVPLGPGLAAGCYLAYCLPYLIRP